LIKSSQSPLVYASSAALTEAVLDSPALAGFRTRPAAEAAPAEAESVVKIVGGLRWMMQLVGVRSATGKTAGEWAVVIDTTALVAGELRVPRGRQLLLCWKSRAVVESALKINARNNVVRTALYTAIHSWNRTTYEMQQSAGKNFCLLPAAASAQLGVVKVSTDHPTTGASQRSRQRRAAFEQRQGPRVLHEIIPSRALSSQRELCQQKASGHSCVGCSLVRRLFGQRERDATHACSRYK